VINYGPTFFIYRCFSSRGIEDHHFTSIPVKKQLEGSSPEADMSRSRRRISSGGFVISENPIRHYCKWSAQPTPLQDFGNCTTSWMQLLRVPASAPRSNLACARNVLLSTILTSAHRGWRINVRRGAPGERGGKTEQARQMPCGLSAIAVAHVLKL